MTAMGIGLGIPFESLGAPLVPPGSPLMWLNADAQALGVTQTWTDLTGNSHSPTQGTVGQRPTNTANSGPGGTRNAMVFVSTNSSSLSLANPLIGQNNFCVAVVGQVTATASAQAFVSLGLTSNGISVLVASAQRNIVYNGNAGNPDTTNAATTSWEAWILNSDSSGNQTFIVNGATHTLTTSPITAVTPTGETDIGMNANTRFLNGGVYDVIVYGTGLTAAQITALKSYQSRRTGLF